ncbi:MAG TPA: response regulator [Candidatus Didemnitutus sp.]|jgi:DNA-binding response OmpR family regulator
MPEPKHILIVDDEPSIREILCGALEMSGYRVSQAESPAAAKRIVAEGLPDLIITDLQLEYSDGLELISEIKVQHPNVPTLLLTGVWFDEKAIEERILKRVSSYIVKTAPLKTVLAEIGRLLAT